MTPRELNIHLKNLLTSGRPFDQVLNAGQAADVIKTLATIAAGVLRSLKAKRELGRVGREALKPTYHEAALREALAGAGVDVEGKTVELDDGWRNLPPPDGETPLTKMAEPLLDDPVYGRALEEAARVNRIGGLRHEDRPVDVNVITIAIARMADEIGKARTSAAVPVELAEAIAEYSKHWRAPVGRTPRDTDSDLDRHAGEQLMSVWRRIRSGEIKAAIEAPRPFDVQHPSYLAVIRERDTYRDRLRDIATALGIPNPTQGAPAQGFVLDAIAQRNKPAASIIPPESPKPNADRRADSAELLKLAEHTIGLAGLERSGYGLRAGDRGVSLHTLAADALGYAMHRLIETGERGVRDAVILLEQIRHEHMSERQAAKPLRWADRMYDQRLGMGAYSVHRLEPLDTGLPPVEALTYTMDHFEADARDRVGSMLGLGNKPMWTKVADALRTARTELAQHTAARIDPECCQRYSAADWFAAGTEWALDQIPNADRRNVRSKRETAFAGQWANNAELRAAVKPVAFTPATTIPGPEHPPELSALVDKMLEPLRKHAAELSARIDEEINQRAPVPHGVLDRAVGRLDSVTAARNNLLNTALGYAARSARPSPDVLARAQQDIINKAIALAVAMLRQTQVQPAKAPSYEECKKAEGYADAVNTLERFRVRAEEASK